MLDHVLVGMNAYVDGFGKLGWAEKIMPPKLKKKGESFRGGGALGDREYHLGYEKLEFEFGLNAFDPHVLRQGGLFRRGVPLSFTSAFDGDRNAQHTGQFICRGEFSELDPGTWDAGKKAVLKAKGTLVAARLIYDGAEIYDIDVENNKYVVNGVDEYAWIRAAL